MESVENFFLKIPPVESDSFFSTHPVAKIFLLFQGFAPTFHIFFSYCYDYELYPILSHSGRERLEVPYEIFL